MGLVSFMELACRVYVDGKLVTVQCWTVRCGSDEISNNSGTKIKMYI